MDSASRPAPAAGSATIDIKSVYSEWANFVWLALQRLGIRPQDLDDVCQDVFLVAHRKRHEFDGRSNAKAWLFGICVRLAANYRRRARFRLERPGLGEGTDDQVLLLAPEWSRPDREAVQRETFTRLEAALERMTPVRRAVLLMFEVEGMSCQDIATELGLPVGTVYSRLHAARKSLLIELDGSADPGQKGAQ